MESNKLITFAKQALQQRDAVIEHDGDLLLCLLPTALAQRLAVEEEWLLSTQHSQDTDALYYGSEPFERLLSLVLDDGCFGHVELPDVSTRGGGLRGELLNTVRLIDCIGEIGQLRVGVGSYLIVFARYLVRWGEMQQGGLVQFACNEETLVPTPWLPDAIAEQNKKSTPSPGWRSPFADLDAFLQTQLESLTTDTIQPFLTKVKHRISQERRRWERIHRRQRKEILRPFADATEATKETILQELLASEQEFFQQVEAIPQRNALQVECQRVAALRVSIPVTRVDYTIRRRKLQRTVPWIWNPLIERFEPRACERTQRETYQITLNDELQLIAPFSETN